MPYYVYILASKKHGVLYTGVTNDIIRRTHQHKNNSIRGFTERYNVKTLVYYEIHDEITAAILREKSIKRWSRTKKISAIEERNAEWVDVYETLL